MTKTIQDLTDGTFEKAIAGEGLSLVAFFAAWCAPCKRMEALLAELAEEQPDVHFYRIDADEQPALAERFSIQTLPAALLFKSGCLVDRTVGNKTKQVLTDFMQSLR